MTYVFLGYEVVIFSFIIHLFNLQIQHKLIMLILVVMFVATTTLVEISMSTNRSFVVTKYAILANNNK